MQARIQLGAAMLGLMTLLVTGQPAEAQVGMLPVDADQVDGFDASADPTPGTLGWQPMAAFEDSPGVAQYIQVGGNTRGLRLRLSRGVADMTKASSTPEGSCHEYPEVALGAFGDGGASVDDEEQQAAVSAEQGSCVHIIELWQFPLLISVGFSESAVVRAEMQRDAEETRGCAFVSARLYENAAPGLIPSFVVGPYETCVNDASVIEDTGPDGAKQ